MAGLFVVGWIACWCMGVCSFIWDVSILPEYGEKRIERQWFMWGTICLLLAGAFG